MLWRKHTPGEKATPQGLRCSFCNKSQDEVAKLIAGPSVCICDECVGVCSDMIAESDKVTPEAMADENTKLAVDQSEK